MKAQVTDRFDEWAKDAACRGMDTRLFYGNKSARYKELRKICFTCPVYKQCLEWALASEGEGMWAGTTELQRVEMRKEMRIQFVRPENFFDVSKSPCGTERGYDRHRRERRALGESGVTCEACKKAHSEYNVENRRSNGGKGSRKQEIK